MRALVVGGSGFLGRAVVERLVTQGDTVFVASRGSASSLSASEGSHTIYLDLLNIENACRVLPANIDVLYILSQSEFFREFPEKATVVFDVNVRATQILVDWAYKSGVRKVVYASSGGVYGPSARRYVSEDEVLGVDSPIGFYLTTKLMGEIIIQNYKALFEGLSILRPFFIYGPKQKDSMLVGRLIQSVISGKAIVLDGPEGLRFNPVYIDDAARIFAAASKVEGVRVFNVAGPDVVTLKGLCELVGHHVGKVPVFEVRDTPPSDYVASIELTSRELLPPTTLVAEGINSILGDDTTRR